MFLIKQARWIVPADVGSSLAHFREKNDSTNKSESYTINEYKITQLLNKEITCHGQLRRPPLCSQSSELGGSCLLMSEAAQLITDYETMSYKVTKLYNSITKEQLI